MSKKLPIVKTLQDADPGYTSARVLRDSLRAKLSEIDKEETELLFRLNNAPPSENARNSRVAALLGDEPPDDGGPLHTVRERISKIHGERTDLRAALEESEKRLAAARHRASTIVCNELQPTYAAAVKDLAAKLIEADAAHRELLAIVEALNAADISWTGHLPPMQAHHLFGHHSSNLARWLHDVVRHGFVKNGDIPKELKQ